jgi:hypothetical protein
MKNLVIYIMETSIYENIDINVISDIKRKKYMRDYMRVRRSDEKHDEIKSKNKAYYYKYKYNITSEDIQKYGNHLSLVVGIRSKLDALKLSNPELLYDILKYYL